MKNIILLITDTYRYTNLGQQTDRPVRTPALDAFRAQRAVSVERFYTGSFPTIPHRTDVAQGVLGWHHYPWQDIRKSGPNHIARLLGQAGYATQLICDCPHLFNHGFQHGFEAAYQTRGQEGDKPLLHLNDPIGVATPHDKTRLQPMWRGASLADAHRWTNRGFRYEADSFCARTGATTVRWLEENCEANPFFLWVDFFDPHEPWDPPEYLVQRYQDAYDGAPMLHPNYGPSSDYTAEELQNLWAHYAAEAEMVDRYLGRVLQKIDDLGLWDDSIVLITSDHGTSVGEHGRVGKSNIHPTNNDFWPIYPEVGHVPFLIAGEGLSGGTSLDCIGQPIDILPTLVDLAGVEVDPETPFDGRSMAPVLRAGRGQHREYAVSGCHLSADLEEVPAKATMPFLVTERWGYAPVGAQGERELYDLAVDPGATCNVATEHADVVQELQALFLQHLRDHHAPEGLLRLWQR